jgi:hypothetical protein
MRKAVLGIKHWGGVMKGWFYNFGDRHCGEVKKKWFNNLRDKNQVLIVCCLIYSLAATLQTIINNISAIYIRQSDKKIESNLEKDRTTNNTVINNQKEESKFAPDHDVIISNDIFQEDVSDEWKLFVFAYNALSFQSRKDIISGYDIYEYSQILEKKILSIIKRNYNNFDLDIHDIDDFLSMNKLDEDCAYVILYEKYKNIDPRLKYALYAYGHTQFIIYYKRNIKDDIYLVDRTAKSLVFALDKNDLGILFRNGSVLQIKQD